MVKRVGGGGDEEERGERDGGKQGRKERRGEKHERGMAIDRTQ